VGYGVLEKKSLNLAGLETFPHIRRYAGTVIAAISDHGVFHSLKRELIIAMISRAASTCSTCKLANLFKADPDPH
jgi:hypothetical protein